MIAGNDNFPFEIRNGKLISSADAFIHSSNRAFRYGDGIFETLCVRNKTVLYFDDHWKRLTNGMHLLRLPMPAGFDPYQLRHQLTVLLESNGCVSGRVRLVVYREATGYYMPDAMNSSWVLTLTGKVDDRYELNQIGINLGIFTRFPKPAIEYSNLKTLNGLPYILAGIAAKEEKFDDMLLLNTHGNIIESVSSNIFLRKGNIIITPPLSEGCLDGVMRKNVILLLRKKNLRIVEEPVTREMAETADEIFLTNVIRGVQWVAAFTGRQFEKNISARLVQWLNENAPLSK